MTIIDLCSGLGRFPGNDVISIDIDRKVKPTIVADVRNLPLRPGIRPQLVHASPPCKYFSQARARRKGYDEKGLAESFRLVAACFDAFDYLEPQMWTLENPNGVLKRILPGAVGTEYKSYDYPHKPTSFWSDNKSLKRAIIPGKVRRRLIKAALSVRTETK